MDSARFGDREAPKPRRFDNGEPSKAPPFDKFDAAAPRDGKPDNDGTCRK
jgi:hypothetical protein